MIRILVVDDKEDNLYYLRSLLGGAGHEVESALHGAEALVKARLQPPDLIVSDLLMPVMDGYTLLRHWKADARLKDIPFIVYTATYTEEEDERLARSFGADAFLLKPAEPEDFLACIREVQARASAAQPAAPGAPADEGPEMLKEYNEALIRKLEQKTLQLEAANRALRQDNAERRRAEEAWRESESRLRAIFETEPECVKIVSPEGRLLEMNRAGLAMLEAGSIEEVQQRSLADFIVPEDRAAFVELHRRVLAGENGRLEFSVVGQRGTRRRLETHATALRGAQGEVTGLLGVTRDITERTLADTRLRVSEAGLAAAQALVHLGSWELDLATMTGSYSAEMFRLFYLDPAHGTPPFAEFVQLVHPADRPIIEQALARTDAAFEPYTIEYRTHPDRGPVRHLSATIVVLRDATGRPVRTAGTVLDITARKQAEAQLRLLETCVARFHDIIIITEAEPVDEPGPRIVFVNDAFVRRTGYTREEALGRSPRFLQGPKTSRAELDRIGAALRRWQPVRGELINYTKAGEEFWLELDIIPVADATGWFTHWVAVERDVTERKRTEEALRASDERFRAFMAHSPAAGWIADAVGRFQYASPGYCQMFGLNEDLLGRHISDLFPPELAAHYLENNRRALAAGSSLETVEPGRRADGSRGEFLTVKFPIEMSGGEPLLGGVALDITERKRTETRMRRLIESNAQGVIFWNRAGAIVEANDAFLRMVGYTREELLAGGLDWAAMTPPEYAELDRRGLEELAARGTCAPFEKEYLRKDGSRVPVLIGAAIFEDDAQEGVAFVLDLTERKKLEQQFLRAQRMESIGTLAGGIAHDLNNVLGPILLSLDLLKMKFPDPASLELIDLIHTSAQRGTDMVRQVLSFARGVEGRRVEVQVRHLVRDIEKIARETFLKNIQVHSTLGPDLWPVLGDPTQLHQVLLNLCVNARDAMPDGGTLTISATNLTLDAQYAVLNTEAHPGTYVLLEVEDSGTGMPPEIIEKIFDPFFTTKEVGRGTGLGLSTTLAIVKSHGGFIRVYSEPGRGTTFKVFLPAQTEPSASSLAARTEELPRGNGELILVVDDEPAVRQITQQTLEAFGYRVLLAADGAEAVAIFARRHAEIALVLTDMMMPIMDGPATMQVLRKMQPAVRIIAASGLAANGQFTQAAGHGVKHFLPKPYTADTMLRTLRQALSGE